MNTGKSKKCLNGGKMCRGDFRYNYPYLLFDVTIDAVV